MTFKSETFHADAANIALRKTVQALVLVGIVFIVGMALWTFETPNVISTPGAETAGDQSIEDWHGNVRRSTYGQ